MKKKKLTRFWYIQDWGTYNVQTPVFFGYTIPEITRIMNKIEIKQEAKNLWNNDSKMTDEVFENKSGGVWRNSGYTLLYLPKFEDTWDLYETILHECVHLVLYQLGGHKMFINQSCNSIEEEGLAYQIEFLFRAIRRKLQSKL